MAALTHNPSRRALLGAAVALSFDTGLRQAQPLLRMGGGGGGAARPLHHSPAANGPPPRSGADWERLLAAYRAAEAAVRAVEGDSAREEEYGDRLGDLYDVLRRLLCLPAPGLGAFALKVVLAIDQELGTLAGGGPCLAAIRREAVALAAGQNPSILFPPSPAMPE